MAVRPTHVSKNRVAAFRKSSSEYPHLTSPKRYETGHGARFMEPGKVLSGVYGPSARPLGGSKEKTDNVLKVPLQMRI